MDLSNHSVEKVMDKLTNALWVIVIIMPRQVESGIAK